MNLAVPFTREGRTFEVRLDSTTGSIIALVTTVATDPVWTADQRSWDVFQPITVQLQASATGVHDLYLTNNADFTNALVADWLVFNP